MLSKKRTGGGREKKAQLRHLDHASTFLKKMVGKDIVGKKGGSGKIAGQVGGAT